MRPHGPWAAPGWKQRLLSFERVSQRCQRQRQPGGPAPVSDMSECACPVRVSRPQDKSVTWLGVMQPDRVSPTTTTARTTTCTSRVTHKLQQPTTPLNDHLNCTTNILFTFCRGGRPNWPCYSCHFCDNRQSPVANRQSRNFDNLTRGLDSKFGQRRRRARSSRTAHHGTLRATGAA